MKETVADEDRSSSCSDGGKVYLSVEMPGREQKQCRLQTEHIEPLIETITGALATAGTNRVRFRTLAGDNQQLWLLRSEGTSSAHTLRETIATQTQAAFTPQFGIRSAFVDLRPIGTAPLVRARLLNHSAMSAPFRRAHDQRAFLTILSRLIKQDIPHIIDVDVRRNGSEYQISLGVAAIEPKQQILSHQDRMQLINGHHPALTVLNQAFPEPGFLTNFSLPIETDTGWHHREKQAASEADIPAGLALEHPVKRDDQQAQLAYKLTDPAYEFQELFADRLTNETLQSAYDRVDVTPWIDISAQHLPAVLGIAPIYYSRSLWETTPRRPGPRVRPLETYRTALGTTQPASANPSIPNLPSAVKTAIAEHEANDEPVARTAAKWFHTQGDTLTAQTKPPYAVFVRQTQGGTTHPVVVASQDTIAAGTLIETASAAMTRFLSLIHI